MTQMEKYCKSFSLWWDAYRNEDSKESLRILRNNAQDEKDKLSDQDFLWAGKWEQRLTARSK